MTSHWPTFADGLFWCACDNRTFETQEAWQLHVALAVAVEIQASDASTFAAANILCSCGTRFSGDQAAAWNAWKDHLLDCPAKTSPVQPPESSSRQAAPSR